METELQENIAVFYTLSLRGIRHFVGALTDFLAGAVIPLPFFPDRLCTFLELLPFAAMQNAPLRIYSGNIAGVVALWATTLQAFWLVVLLLIGRTIHRFVFFFPWHILYVRAFQLGRGLYFPTSFIMFRRRTYGIFDGGDAL